MLGHYHDAVRDFDHKGFHWPRERYGPVALRQILDRLLENWRGQMSPRLESLAGELDRNARDLAIRFAALGQLPKLVIHGDYHAGNLILRQGAVVGVVDYDLAHWCWRAMEVAEAVIAFATQHPGGLRHIVYSGVLDLDAVHRFLVAYAESASLSKAEIHALPDLIRTIWLCASIDPPLEPILSLEAGPRALPEILTLAGWAQDKAADIIQIGLDARAKNSDPP
jgi:Ser/Thr protein kinase RdoA (MazF antagonist)